MSKVSLIWSNLGVVVCCSVLQCVAVCCSKLQCVAVCCSVLQCVAVCCSVLQCVAVCGLFHGMQVSLHQHYVLKLFWCSSGMPALGPLDCLHFVAALGCKWVASVWCSVWLFWLNVRLFVIWVYALLIESSARLVGIEAIVPLALNVAALCVAI